jgi:hypothetical protein
MKKILMLGLLLALLTTVASAQKGADRLRKHQITQGIRKGQLTRSEVFELRKSHLRRQMVKRRALRDGYLSPLEKRRLMMQNHKMRRELFIKKHNTRRRLI